MEGWLPAEGAGALERGVPTIVEFTRYWRAIEGEDPLPRVAAFTARGFAYMIVDGRGSGASFGFREAEQSTAEARDFYHVIEWIAGQPWSNGAVATTGVSYAGNTAESAMIGAPTALRATIPRFTDFDMYASLIFPGGLAHTGFVQSWSEKMRRLDRNEPSIGDEIHGKPVGPDGFSVKPVDGDSDRELLARALAEHRQNVSLDLPTQGLVYREDFGVADTLQDPGDRLISPFVFQRDDRLRAIPSYHWASFVDAGTAAGAIARFVGSDAPMKVIIGYWTHGAYLDANPYSLDREVAPSIPEQYRMMADFLDPLMRQIDTPVGMPAVRSEVARSISYFTAGQDVWKTTTTWPPPGSSLQRFHFSQDASLIIGLDAVTGLDSYTVDFAVGTGSTTRWSTQLGGKAVDYGDRAEVDKRLLTYTSPPLEADVEITGTPVVCLMMSSSDPDGAVIAYLEEVGPDGRVTMLTEGQLRLIHRKVSTEEPPYPMFGPYHTFERKDSEPMMPDEFAEVTFSLLPLSIEVKAGHRLRIAISGHDRDNFEPVPCKSNQVYKFKRGQPDGSYIDLPIVRAGADWVGLEPVVREEGL